MSKSKSVSHAVPGKPMTLAKLKGLIAAAEEGTCVSVAESKRRFKAWRKKHSK